MASRENSKTTSKGEVKRFHPTRPSLAEPSWANASDAELLSLGFCDLGVRIQGTALVPRIRKLQAELKAKHLIYRPHCWLAEEWFSPDGVPGIGIPFYLAHPRLMQLQMRQMLEVEGGTEKSCLRILRHEAGHAIDTAYRLSRKKRWRETFGKASQTYPDYYIPKPHSRRYVQHLAAWYAQSHPSEDFAETFAVWLTPDFDWKKRYRDWPALKKLEYVDELMGQLVNQQPPVQDASRVEPIVRLKKTLGEHYQEKRAWYGIDSADVYDRDLRRIFSDDPEHARNETAAAFLKRIRSQVRKRVAFWTNAYQYMIDQVLKEMISRCRELKLRVHGSEPQTNMDAVIMVTVQTMKYLGNERHRIPL